MNAQQKTRHTWKAGHLVREMGVRLVGRAVETQPYGEWTGGTCVVTEIHPDPGAPEIVFNVRRESDGAEIGVFDHEPVVVSHAG